VAFSVPPAPVAHRSRWPVALLASVAVLFVVVAIGGRIVSSGVTGAASSVEAGASSIAAGSQAAVAATPKVARIPAAAPPIELPPITSCQGGDARWCRQVLRAAMAAYFQVAAANDADAIVSSASVWHSIACGDSLDCPRYRLVNSTPVGSVVLEFAGGGPRAWINVVGPAATRELDGGPGNGLIAWIARWG
jgi:hypothetical protein